MKQISLEKEKEFIENCAKLKEIIYHNKSTILGLNFVFHLQDYKRNFKNFLKQTKYFFTGREVLPKNKLKILIMPDGGIGDIVLSRIFAYKLKQILPESFIAVSFKNKQVLEMLFDKQNLIDLITTNAYKNDYDLVFSGMRLFALEVKNKKNVEQFAPQILTILNKAEYRQKEFSVFTNTPCSTEYPLIHTILKLGVNVREANFWLNGFDDIKVEFPPYFIDKNKEENTLETFGLKGKKYITIHDGFDNNLPQINTRNKKCWLDSYWREFIKLFKQKYPSILVVQLGAKHSEIFQEADISLVNKTSLLDLPFILNNSLLHIDGESGLTHLRTALGKVSTVMCGPSTKEYSFYEQNINLVSQICTGCMDIKNTWQHTCMLNLKEDCMTSIKPQRVLDSVNCFFNNKSIKEIQVLDMQKYPISNQLEINKKCLQNLCEEELPFAKIGYNFGPAWFTRPIIRKITKSNKKLF